MLYLMTFLLGARRKLFCYSDWLRLLQPEIAKVFLFLLSYSLSERVLLLH